MEEHAWSRFLLTTCCQTFRSSSIRTGLMRKSTAPCVTPRSTTVVSPLDDITVTQQHISLSNFRQKQVCT